jgi:hypothetical protein
VINSIISCDASPTELSSYYRSVTEFNVNNDNTTTQLVTGNQQAVETASVEEKNEYQSLPLVINVDDDYMKFSKNKVVIYHQAITSAFASVTITPDLVKHFFDTIAAASNPLGKKLANFYYVKGKIKVSVKVQGQAFAAGKLVLAFYPRPIFQLPHSYSTTQVVKTKSRVNCFVVPHLEIDPSKSGISVIDLPEVTPTGLYSAAGTPNVGSYLVDLMVINPLFSGTATAAKMNLCIFMEWSDAIFEAPTMTAASVEWKNPIAPVHVAIRRECCHNFEVKENKCYVSLKHDHASDQGCFAVQDTKHFPLAYANMPVAYSNFAVADIRITSSHYFLELGCSSLFSAHEPLKLVIINEEECLPAELLESMAGFEAEHLTASPVQEQKSTLSSFVKDASIAAGAAAAAGTVFTPALTLFSTVAGIGASVLSWFGFGKPSAVENEVIVLNRFGDNFSQFDGKSTSIVLAGSAKTSLGIDPSLGSGKPNDMLLSHLCSIKGLVKTDNISLAEAAGSLAYTLVNYPLVVDSPAATKYAPTPLAGVGFPFKYWIGSLKWEFDIVASVFHRATLVFAWNPIVPSAPPTMEEAIQTLHHVVVDVTGNCKVPFIIPWKQNAVAKRCDLGFRETDAVPNNSADNGITYVYVLNPVETNGSTDGIEINSFLSSDDIQFFVPDVRPLQDLIWESETLTAAPVERQSLRVFGENYHSVKQLTSKLTPAYSYIEFITDTTVDKEPFRGIHFPNAPFQRPNTEVNTGDTYYWPNFASYFATAFLGYRGGMRYSFHARDDNKTETKPHYFFAHSRQQVNVAALDAKVHMEDAPLVFAREYAWGIANKLVSPTADFTAPSLLPYDYMNTREVVLNYPDSIFAVVGMNEFPTAPADSYHFDCTLCSGTADDGVYCFFLGFPEMAPRGG